MMSREQILITKEHTAIRDVTIYRYIDTIYRYIAIFATGIQYNMNCILQYIVWWAVTSLLIIKFLGGQSYLKQTLGWHLHCSNLLLQKLLYVLIT